MLLGLLVPTSLNEVFQGRQCISQAQFWPDLNIGQFVHNRSHGHHSIFDKVEWFMPNEDCRTSHCVAVHITRQIVLAWHLCFRIAKHLQSHISWSVNLAIYYVASLVRFVHRLIKVCKFHGVVALRGEQVKQFLCPNVVCIQGWIFLWFGMCTIKQYVSCLQVPMPNFVLVHCFHNLQHDIDGYDKGNGLNLGPGLGHPQEIKEYKLPSMSSIIKMPMS